MPPGSRCRRRIENPAPHSRHPYAGPTELDRRHLPLRSVRGHEDPRNGPAKRRVEGQNAPAITDPCPDTGRWICLGCIRKSYISVFALPLANVWRPDNCVVKSAGVRTERHFSDTWPAVKVVTTFEPAKAHFNASLSRGAQRRSSPFIHIDASSALNLSVQACGLTRA